MWQRILNLWEQIRTSYWFVPGLLCVAAAIAAEAAVRIDRAYAEHWKSVWLGNLIPRVQPASAQSMLEVIGSTSITVAGIVFSITIAALAIASTQYGPRLLRQFMRDRATQVVLGVYVATTLYCFLVLRTLTSLEHGEFAPRLGVFGALALAIAELPILIFFIHHISVSIQAETVVERAAEEAMGTVNYLFPTEDARRAEQHPPANVPLTLPDDFDQRSRTITCKTHGYIRRIDLDALAELAKHHDLLIRHHTAGHYVLDDAIATVYPAERVTPEISNDVRGAFVLGPTRSPTQDIRYTLDRLVEVASRALSPGTNDPFTAVACIDRLGVALTALAARPFPSGVTRDETGRPRLFGEPPDFENLLSYAFDAIRQYAGEHLIVTAEIFEVLARIGAAAAAPERRDAVRRLADRTWTTCKLAQTDDPSLPALRAAYEQALAACGAASSTVAAP